ncbi:uncharacterized protein METZ01_LOCUS258386, partial [marine metagenome]
RRAAAMAHQVGAQRGPAGSLGPKVRPDVDLLRVHRARPRFGPPPGNRHVDCRPHRLGTTQAHTGHGRTRLGPPHRRSSRQLGRHLLGARRPRRCIGSDLEPGDGSSSM